MAIAKKDRRKKSGWKSALVAVLVFAALLLAGAGFGMWMSVKQGASIHSAELKELIIPAVGFLIYLLWVALVLTVIRPWLAARLSRTLGITIEESLHTGGIAGGGGWTVTSRWSLWKRLVLYTLEILVFVALLIGPLAAGILLFL